MTQPELDIHTRALRDKLIELANGSRNRRALEVEPTADEMDQTQVGQERDMAVGICNRDTKLASDLRAALDRIDEGTFGTCVDCDLDISPKRLAAVPWAESCISCQEAADLRAGQPWSAAEDALENAA